MTAHHLLKRQQERMQACLHIGQQYKHAGLIADATDALVKLNWLAAVYRPAHPNGLAAEIGPNKHGPWLDAIASSARFAKRFPLLAIIETKSRRAA